MWLKYNCIPYSLCCYSTTASPIPFVATVLCCATSSSIPIVATTSSSVSYVVKTSSFIPFLATVQPHHTSPSLPYVATTSSCITLCWYTILYSLCCYCTASSSIPYNVSTLSFISSVVATSSYNIYVTKTLNSFPHPLFIMFLQPHPVLIYSFLTSSSIPYVATTSSSITLCCYDRIL